ncbi:serine/threonine protein kinase [Streptomyces aquilus]|uniref:non-specific serine/threonine protein kinase n=1 Tax=Streptomyces aquilus TaxID=2548456 RepID=A0A3Q9C3E9_9ACTN|nr:serine/threonine-protein kinase [Streptomyces aquilus]AZP19864.1 serine/threonine protein kinase [Streptomyces aquilus]
MSNDGGGVSPKGRLIGGRYRLVERIGSGGMGTVWRALDGLVDRDVAVKQPRLPGDPEDEAHQRASHRLYREARAAARVDHPAAVSIHDVVVEDGLPWIVMELVRGESLHAVLERGPLEPAEAARIGLAVLGALRAAHAVGIVHRDVKPANVLLGSHHRVVLTDFGIAHVQGEDSLTATGEFVGSLEFIAPERMSGRSAGPASDLWSLGVLLYAAVEGWSPFRRTSVESTLAAILTAEVPEPKQAGPLGPLLTRLLEKDPAGRPDAEEIEAALAAAAGEWPRAAEDPGLQDASGLEEFGDDIGTVRLGQAGADADTLTAVGAPADDTVPEPAAAGRRMPRPLSLALTGGLLVGATWFGIASLTGPDSGAGTKNTAADHSASPETETETETKAPPTPAPTSADGWTAHADKGMNATLVLPAAYKEFARSGSDTFQPRQVEYAAGSVQVRFTKWDKAPGTPMSQAEQHVRTAEFFENPTTPQYTTTSLHGWDAVQSDITYGDKDLRRRLLELFVRTDDNRLYELRVEMPKGTAEEKRGTAVFKDARDRLTIATTP